MAYEIALTYLADLLHVYASRCCMQLALAAQSEALLASTLIELHVRRHFVLAESFTFAEQDSPVVPGQRYMLPALDIR